MAIMPTMEFRITFDYLCPFARNANEAVLNGLEAGRDWDAAFHPFSLAQVHVEEGEPDAWDRDDASGVLALQWGLAARDHHPDVFPALHRELFAARHDHGQDIKDEAVLRQAAQRAGADADQIASTVAGGAPLRTLQDEHLEAVAEWSVFGVPTFIVNDGATFIRFMSRGSVDDLDRALELLSWPELNEFKRTVVPR
jgi:protein-disulfide isomerase-like protein with CxxC motif